jgi:hypothetical protein
MLWAKKHAPTPFPSIVFTFGFAIESIKEFGVCQPTFIYNTITYKSTYMHIYLTTYLQTYLPIFS